MFGQHRGLSHNSSGFFLCVFSTMTAPVLELSCDVTPTSKVAKTGEWSLEKMSSVQPGAKTNLFFLTEILCELAGPEGNISQEEKKKQ